MTVDGEGRALMRMRCTALVPVRAHSRPLRERTPVVLRRDWIFRELVAQRYDRRGSPWHLD